MKFKKRFIVIALVIITVISAAVIIMVIEKSNSSQSQNLKIMTDNVDLQVKDVNYTDVGDSGLKWEIKANSAKYMKNENLAIFEHVRIKLVMQDGKSFVMTGDKGILKTDTKDMEISGNVEVVSDRGDHLNTDNLKYSGSEQRIYTEAPVKMENDRMQVKGVGMTLSLNDKDVSLLSKVKANIR